MAKIARLGIYTLVALLLVLLPAAVLAQPQVSGFYGSVTGDGKSPADGTVVSAWIDGVKKIPEAKTATYAGKSVYVLDVAGESALEGKDIVFKIGDATATQKGKYVAGKNVGLDLTATTATPTATATATPTGTATATPTATPPTGDNTLPLVIGMLAVAGAFLTAIGVWGYRKVRA